MPSSSSESETERTWPRTEAEEAEEVEEAEDDDGVEVLGETELVITGKDVVEEEVESESKMKSVFFLVVGC
jgi:hypothetical protein